MTFQDIRRDLCAFVISEGAQGNLDIPVEAISAASKALGALETIRAEVAEIGATARMREDTEVTFTAGIIAGVIDREIARVEGNT
jgi:hypothetical protein